MPRNPVVRVEATEALLMELHESHAALKRGRNRLKNPAIPAALEALILRVSQARTNHQQSLPLPLTPTAERTDGQ